MRSWQSRLGLLAAVGATLVVTSTAVADVTSERSSSILVFPKVIANSTRDTIIQIVNASNSLARAHCFYVNAALTDPTQPESVLNPRQWIETDFTITLTRQQPTYWYVSTGRRVDPFDPACTRQNDECPYSGLDPGLIPPVVPDFEGELKCVQVDDGGAPVAGNALIGVARLLNAPFPDPVPPGATLYSNYSAYNALGVLGIENDGDGTLVLGGGQCSGNSAICRSDDDCQGEGVCVLEYNACPGAWLLNHLAENAPNIVLEDVQEGETSTSVETELTIVPCTQNFETQIQTHVTVQFQIWNEFESQFSVSTSVTCWGSFFLDEIGATALTFQGQVVRDALGTSYLHTRMRNAEGTPYGLLIVAEEFHVSKASFADVNENDNPIPVTVVSTAASQLHVEGEHFEPDIITIPAEQLEP